MTKRKLLILLTMVGLLAVLTTPAVRYRLIGWARGEPFWKGMPASYYADRARTFWREPRMGERAYPRCRDTSAAERYLRRHLSGTCDRLLDSIWPICDPFHPNHGYPHDADMVPVLIALMSEPERRVRFYAAGIAS